MNREQKDEQNRVAYNKAQKESEHAQNVYNWMRDNPELGEIHIGKGEMRYYRYDANNVMWMVKELEVIQK